MLLTMYYSQVSQDWLAAAYEALIHWHLLVTLTFLLPPAAVAND